ncbi:hypothetical protein SDC9_123019 [bioreactor metagenome]|uniref:GTP cyclohydrolase 1 type 2 n=1 Tax=bioreactor metagenome TaxID=1076179 RepID=A0A645CGF9_9ZZZZ
MFTQYFGQYLLNKAYLTPEQLGEGLEYQQNVRLKLGVLAVNAGYISADDADKINEAQKRIDKRFGEIAVDMGYLKEEQVDELLSTQKFGYLLLGQALVDKGYLTLQEFEKAIKEYKRDYSISDKQFEAMQKDDVEEIINRFVEFRDSKNEKVIKEAMEKNVDLIVTHHPFIFRKMNKINTKDLKGRLIHKLIKNDIALYSMHTNFDIAFDGLNDYFMEVMEFENCKILDVTNSETLYKLAVYTPMTHEIIVREALGESGAGYIGNYSNCTFNSPGIGTFRPEDNSNPFIGKKGKMEEVKEVKIETIVPSSILQNTISKMIKAHPYEEVAYDIYK